MFHLLLLGHTQYLIQRLFQKYVVDNSERMENVVVDVASGKISKEQLKEIIIELLEL